MEENGMQTAEPVSKVNLAAVEGLKLAAISIIFMLISTLIPQNFTGGIIAIVISLLKLGATITFLWFAMKKFSVRNAAVEGFTTYGKVFSFGFLTSLFSGIILAIFTFVNMKFISPESTEAAKEAYLTQLSAMPTIDPVFVEKFSNNLEVFTSTGTLFMAILYGVIWSLILASSTKINPVGNFNN
ncbi:MAG: DUF4199 domain-containing protein [Bacteroidales bacterium]|nr:DUF4199 domain-containing protein [Bacteroidales bacterium]